MDVSFAIDATTESIPTAEPVRDCLPKLRDAVDRRIFGKTHLVLLEHAHDEIGRRMPGLADRHIDRAPARVHAFEQGSEAGKRRLDGARERVLGLVAHQGSSTGGRRPVEDLIANAAGRS
jgi:hypothetical protein